LQAADPPQAEGFLMLMRNTVLGMTLIAGAFALTMAVMSVSQ
jgi:hypothetical protein